MNKLWSYAVFRWCVYQTPLLVFVLLLRGGLFDFRYQRPYEIWDWELLDWMSESSIWILILTLPIVWVWRKPIWKMVKQALGFLNKKAEED